MKHRKLRGYVLPTVYLLTITAIFISVISIGKFLNKVNDAGDYSYVTRAFIDNVTTVINSDNKEIKKPFTAENVKISKEFYKKDDDPDKQKNSLIYYENTYMQNSGLLYTSDKEFDCVAVLDGKVTNIKEDNILGMVVEVEHSSNLTTIYQSLGKLNVSVGQEIKQGDVIGVSGSNNLENESDYCLHFEVFLNGNLVNPTDFYEMKLEALS